MLDQRKVINWRNCVFFLVTSALGLAGAPLYFFWNGMSGPAAGIFVLWVVLTGYSITIGYHRMFAHRAFDANRFIKILALFFGAAAFQESALQWASQHRAHHKFIDTERDPYNIKEGFFYAHMGWLLFRKHAIDYENVKDLASDPWARFQHQHYTVWAVVSGVLLPAAIGAWLGDPVGAFLFGVAARLTYVHQGTFLINSVCHYFGTPVFDRDSSPRDHWLAAFITNGEGYHSYHHRFPSDYRNGFRWYHWDPSKWIIALLSRAGLASNLKRASAFQILAARLSADKRFLESQLVSLPVSIRAKTAESLKAHYETLREALLRWEACVKEYLRARRLGPPHSKLLKREVLNQVREARKTFLLLRSRWSQFVNQPSLLLGNVCLR